jgi:uncharacterized membrane protein YqaE (UPF0057 family)
MTMRGKRSFNLTKGQENNQPRKTALVVAAVLGALAAWNVYRGRPVRAEALGGIAATLLIVGLFLPPIAVYFHRGWMAIATALGFVNSRILLTVMYYFVITPFGWVRRAMGRDPLLRRTAAKHGYWIPRRAQQQSHEQFERAF